MPQRYVLFNNMDKKMIQEDIKIVEVLTIFY
jgi:hypothetical protein